MKQGFYSEGGIPKPQMAGFADFMRTMLGVSLRFSSGGSFSKMEVIDSASNALGADSIFDVPFYE